MYMKNVIIAEKPSVAQSIAAIVGAGQRRDGYIEGNGYAVTWAFGHLVQLAMPEAYGFAGFRRENLPMLPAGFTLIPRQIREGKEYKDDPGVVRQLNIIKGLFEGGDRIIVATDAGREEELIFRYIYHYLGCTKPFVRLWISSLTDKAIREGMGRLQPGGNYDNLYLSAKARSEADWLIGINGSQALSLAAGRGVFSLGRVQTPTLGMICSRYLENRSFTPKKYMQICITVEKDGIAFHATAEQRYENKAAADNALGEMKVCGTFHITELTRREVKEEPPLLYDLTALQREANTRLDFSADRTLSLAQSLYEKKVLSYPRTGSRYVSEDVFDEIPSRITLLRQHPRFGQYAASLSGTPLNRRSVDGGKVTDHHALIITENLPDGLSKDEQAIYDMVAARLLEAFSAPCIKRKSTRRWATTRRRPKARWSSPPDGVPCAAKRKMPTRMHCFPVWNRTRASRYSRSKRWSGRPNPSRCTPKAPCSRRWSIAAGRLATNNYGQASARRASVRPPPVPPLSKRCSHAVTSAGRRKASCLRTRAWRSMKR